MDEGYSLWLLGAAFLIWTLVHALFYGFGAAIQKIDQTELSREEERGDKRAAGILKIAANPTQFIHTMQIVTSAFSFFVGAVILIHLHVFVGGENQRTCILRMAVTFLLYMLMLIGMIAFGIVIPKKLALGNPVGIARAGLRWIRWFIWLCLPFSFFLNIISKFVLGMFGINLEKEEEVTKEDIINMIYAGQEEGTLEEENVEMIKNIFHLDNKKAGEIMTNRKNLVCIHGEMTLREAADFMLNEGNNSRYPVYKDDIDDIIGVLNMKDALIHLNNSEEENTPLIKIKSILRKAHYIPETRNVDALFKEMQSRKIHMVIVVDEYGQTAGIVTLEDILEEIVGNILDEYDVDEKMIIDSRDGSFIMKGMTPLDDVADKLDLWFDEEDYNNFDTLNGFIIGKLDRIPRDGEQFSFTYSGYEFRVVKVEKKMIQVVKILRMDSPKSEQQEEVENAQESRLPHSAVPQNK